MSGTTGWQLLHQHILVISVPQQNNVCCHTAKLEYTVLDLKCQWDHSLSFFWQWSAFDCFSKGALNKEKQPKGAEKKEKKKKNCGRQTSLRLQLVRKIKKFTVTCYCGDLLSSRSLITNTHFARILYFRQTTSCRIAGVGTIWCVDIANYWYSAFVCQLFSVCSVSSIKGVTASNPSCKYDVCIRTLK